jgi:CRP-like cAMP-binding protein
MNHAGPTNIYQAPPDRIAEKALEQGAKLELVAAGHVILGQGETASSLYLLRQGICCAAIETNDRKFTLDVFLDGYVFTAMESLSLQVPSAFSIEAVTESAYVAIPRATLESILSNPEIRAQFGIHHQLTNMRMTRRLIDLMTTSPLERYVQFVNERPDLIERLPQYMIASMLGISPESLSRVRRRLAKKTKK